MPLDKTKSITLIEGDGIGPEICAEVLKISAALALPLNFEPQFAGETAFKKYGDLLPEETLRSIQKNRVVLKGPLTTPVGKGFRSVNVQLRKHFELFVNLRPIKSWKNLSRYPQVDLVIVRENTEDLYVGLEHSIASGVAESIKVTTRAASLRIAEYAFQYAKGHGRRQVTVVHKANILKLTDGLFLDCAREVARKYPDVECRDLIVDNACLQLVTKPEQFDLMLMSNLYGDILSDLAAGLVGGLGVVPGANLGKKCAIFEAVHGSAPDIAGKGIANPSAILMSFAMLLDHIDLASEAQRLRQALEKVFAQPKSRTRDLGGKLTTSQFGDAVVEALAIKKSK